MSAYSTEAESQPQQSINPYAPTTLDVQRKSSSPPPAIEMVTNVKLAFSTIGSVAGAGAVFGVGLIVCVMIADAQLSDLPAALIGAPVGAIWALIGAGVVVPLTLDASFSVRANEAPWRAQEIFLFGVICGFGTGFCLSRHRFSFNPASRCRI